MGGESRNVNLSLASDDTMLHPSLVVLELDNRMERAKVATPLDAIFACSSSMDHDDDAAAQHFEGELKSNTQRI